MSINFSTRIRHNDRVRNETELLDSVYRFHYRWAHRGVFAHLFEAIASEQNRDGFKIIAAAHVKGHQDACLRPQAADQRLLGKTLGFAGTAGQIAIDG